MTENVEMKYSDGLLEDQSFNEIEQYEMRIRAQENALTDVRQSYNTLNAEYLKLEAQYNDCAGRIGIDADKLSQTEALLGLARDDNDYLARSLDHKKQEVKVWQSRAEGCMAEKDGLLALLDEARTAPAGDKSGPSEADWKTMGECCMSLMGLSQTLNESIKPGMTDIEVMRLKMSAAQAVMAIAEKLPS